MLRLQCRIGAHGSFVRSARGVHGAHSAKRARGCHHATSGNRPSKSAERSLTRTRRPAPPQQPSVFSFYILRTALCNKTRTTDRPFCALQNAIHFFLFFYYYFYFLLFSDPTNHTLCLVRRRFIILLGTTTATTTMNYYIIFNYDFAI